MIPLDRLRELEQGRACDVNSPDYFAVTSELLHIREMAAEMPEVAHSLECALAVNGRHGCTCYVEGIIFIRDAAHAAKLAEAQEQYRAAVAENVALIATGAELKEECARMREFAQHGSNCEFGWGGSKCECGLLDILYRGAKP